MSKKEEQELRKRIEVFVEYTIDKIDKKIKEEHSGSAVKGRVKKQSFINIFISLKDIKKGIPEYADAIINEMSKSKTRRSDKKPSEQKARTNILTKPLINRIHRK